MISNRHIDNNQYSLEYNKSYLKKRTVQPNMTVRVKNSSIKKSLEDSVSFKGFQVSREFEQFKSHFLPLVIRPRKELVKKVFKTLGEVSTEQHRYYDEIRNNFINLVKTDKNFCKKFGISDDIATKISKDNLYFVPKDQIATKFIKNLFSPVTFLWKKTSNLFIDKNSKAFKQNAYYEKTVREYKCLEGLIRSVEIWENAYRRNLGYRNWSKGDDFVIPNEVLHTNLNRRRNKIVDPTKGKYSSTSLMIGNRFISGIVYAYFLGNDAYNTTMRYSNNKSEASVQRKSRIAQEFSRIGLNMYIQNLLFGTLESSVNRSLPMALIVSGSTTAFSEILGRKLVGKPIVPSNKATLDRMETEMQAKKGILPAIGKLLTGAKKKEGPSTPIQKLESKNAPNSTLFASFSTKSNENVLQSVVNSDTKLDQKSNPSFKGFYATDRLFSKNRILTLLKVLENADYKQAQFMKKTLVNCIKYSDLYANNPEIKKVFEDFNRITMNRSFVDDDYYKVFDQLMQMTDNQLPIGKNKTLHGQILKSLLVPVNFVRNIFYTIRGWSFGYSSSMSGKDISTYSKLFSSRKVHLTDKDVSDMQAYYDNFKEQFPWKNVGMPENIKKIKLYKEYINNRERVAEDIEGAKNILMLIEKEIVSQNIKVQKDGTLSPQDVEKIRKILKDLVLKADGAKHVEYDGNALSQMNVNLGRAITTIFLVTDAFNLTMQYSNDDKKAARKSAQNRTAQEISRIGLSAYMLAFVHNLLAKVCNSSLAGAFSITALTSIINDSLSRKVVGVPITPKNRDELLEIDKKNTVSKSPIKKALAYSLGKKSAVPPTIKTNPTNSLSFFITPAIEFKNKKQASD